MVSETQTPPRSRAGAVAWPPHDTEESILGTDLHQTTITNLRWGINEAAAAARQSPQEPVPWQALSQIIFLGCVRLDGTEFRTYPDIFVYQRPINPGRGSLSLAVDGPPAMIIEVLSESTFESDLDLDAGKGYSYAQAGVREYLTLDPTGEYLAEGIRAWRLEVGAYRPWLPEADGRWHSTLIGVAIALEGAMATVYARAGWRLLREGEVEIERARLRDEAALEQARLQEQLASKDAELARLRRLLGDDR